MVPQGSPQVSESQSSSLTRQSDGLHFTGETLTYRITGLTSYNLERLRVTVKASAQPSAVSAQANHSSPDGCRLTADSCFHIDTLDLYSSRARQEYAEACAKYLRAPQGHVLAELGRIISALEAERVAMRQRGSAAAVPTMSEQEKREALEALRDKDLLRRIVSDFDGIGFIGEKRNKVLGYLAAVSRLQPDPLAILILSRSGAGKTSLQDAVCKFVPPESVIQYTRLTGQSLFYRDANALRHKVLAIEEEDGMREAMYSIKTLISAQKLSIAATRTDAKTGKFSVDEYTVHGPVVVIISTTNPDALDDETKQRFLILTVDETAEHTKSILAAQITKNTEEWYRMTGAEQSVTRLHHTMQRLLRPLTVTFTRELRLVWPYSRLQMRREQSKFVSLVKAIALLYQYQRKTGTLKRADGSKMEYVQATQADVDLALELGREAFARNVDDVSPTARRLLAEIVTIVKVKCDALKGDEPSKDLFMNEVPFTRKELREGCGWSEAQVRRNAEQLVELGYLGRIGGARGATCRYLLLDDGSADPELRFGAECKAGEAGEPTTKNQRVNGKTSSLRPRFVTSSSNA